MKIKNIYLLKQFIKLIAWGDNNNNLKELYSNYNNKNNYYSLYDLLNNYNFLNDMLKAYKGEEIEKDNLILTAKMHTMKNYYFN